LREMNIVHKRGSPGSLKIGLLYPSTYAASLASLSYQAMYYYINSWREFVAERFVHTRRRPPIGLDAGSKLSSMDAIIASVHYELDYANLLEMLRSSGVEVLRAARRSKPPIVIGGPPLAANPLPLSDVADLVVIGDMEPLLPGLLEALAADPRSIADVLAGKDGFFAAGADHVRLVRALELSPEFHPIAQIQPMDVEPVWGRSLLVESTRGCSRACRFCMEGSLYSPRVDRPLRQIKRIIDAGLPANGVNKITFYSLSFFDHGEADAILSASVEAGAQVSIPSLRVDTLDVDRIRAIAGAGQRTLTVAPESGMCRLRRALGKPWSRDELIAISRAASSSGIGELKLYYMVGLPGEGPDAPGSIAREVLDVKAASSHIGISVSLTPFMPKPQTPLQWAGMEDVKSLERKMAYISSALRAGGIAVDYYSPRLAAVQVSISRAWGDPGTLCLLDRRSRGLSWGNAFRLCGLAAGSRTAPLDPGRDLPWSIVDPGRPADERRNAMDLYWLELGRGCAS